MRSLTRAFAQAFDRAYLRLDRRRQRRTRCLRLVPDLAHRRGGKLAYGEWCWAIGIFQALIHAHLPRRPDPRILDVGCGTGLLAIASEPCLGERGRYLGIDVSRADVEFCRAHYPSPAFSFQVLEARHPVYAPEHEAGQRPWDVPDASIHLATALSVWTHFAEGDGLFYFCELDRVLRPGGRAILTCFLLDDAYRASLPRAPGASLFHATPRERWVFEVPARGSPDWLHPAWARVPEEAIGVTPAGLERMRAGTRLRLLDSHPGTWREAPGLYFQDVLVFARE
jgi:SAM-dependent methyltransferase